MAGFLLKILSEPHIQAEWHTLQYQEYLLFYSFRCYAFKTSRRKSASVLVASSERTNIVYMFLAINTQRQFLLSLLCLMQLYIFVYSEVARNMMNSGLIGFFQTMPLYIFLTLARAQTEAFTVLPIRETAGHHPQR